jgi:hypothetical protein
LEFADKYLNGKAGFQFFELANLEQAKVNIDL